MSIYSRIASAARNDLLRFVERDSFSSFFFNRLSSRNVRTVELIVLLSIHFNTTETVSRARPHLRVSALAAALRLSFMHRGYAVAGTTAVPTKNRGFVQPLFRYQIS